MTKPDDQPEDMQEKLRKTGARRVEHEFGFEAYQTNQGTVIFGSPADYRRAQMMRQRIVRARAKTSEPIPRALLEDPELDIDFSAVKEANNMFDCTCTTKTHETIDGSVELEKHRAEARSKLGGDVEVVGSVSTSYPEKVDGVDGEVLMHVYITNWRKATSQATS